MDDDDDQLDKILNEPTDRGVGLADSQDDNEQPSTDDGEGSHVDVRRDLGVGMDHGRGVNARGHRSRTMAPISASATTSPSTRATPDILHIIPRTCWISMSNRI